MSAPSYAPPLFTHYDSSNGAISPVRNQPNRISIGKQNAHPAAQKAIVGAILVIQNDSGVAGDLTFSGAGSYSTVSALAAGANTSLTLTTDGITTFSLNGATGTIYCHDEAVPPSKGVYAGTYAIPYNGTDVQNDTDTFENQD